MKLTNRQRQMINEMVRDEAERFVKGQRLRGARFLSEAGADTRAIKRDITARGHEAAARWANIAVNGFFQKLIPIVAEGLSRVGVGDVTPGDVQELMLASNEDTLKLEYKLIDDLAAAGEAYTQRLADLLLKVISESIEEA